MRFDETTEKQHERGERQLGVCALLPQSERESFLTLAIKKEEGISNFKSSKDQGYDDFEVPFAVDEFAGYFALGFSKKSSGFATSTISPS